MRIDQNLLRPSNWARLWTRLLITGVFWSGLVTLTRVAGFVLVLPLVLKHLPSQEVGLWYVLSGIAGFCALLEIGFSSVISRFASFYAAGFQELPSLGHVHSPEGYLGSNSAGLIGLIFMARKLYLNFALITVMTMFLGGLWLYLKYGALCLRPDHLLAFGLMTAGTAWSMAEYYWPGMLFGLNRVKEYHQALLEGIILNYLVTIFGILAHWGLLSLVVGQMTSTVYQRLKSQRYLTEFSRLDFATEPLPVSWLHLWPMSWRSGIMGLAIYLSFYSLNLVCAQVFDLMTTASFALSLQLVMMAQTLASTWVQVKYPTFVTLYAGRRYAEIRQIAFQRLIYQTITYVGASALAWLLAPFLLHHLGAKTNFLSPLPLAAFMAVSGVDLLINSMASIVHSGNQFPFVQSYVCNGLLTVGLAFVLGKSYGILGLIGSPLLAQLLFNGWYVGARFWEEVHRLDRNQTDLDVVPT